MRQPKNSRSAVDKPLIELNRISKTYHNAAGDFPALREVDAWFYPGEFVAVIGKSGSGKSTLVNMITGIDHPSSGGVQIEGVNVHEMSESHRAAWRGLNLGIIFQFFQLLPNLTLLENVMLPMDFCQKYRSAERPARARELLAQVRLEDHADALPLTVSGGEQQRAAIARALANDPPIIVADEPTGNLDSNTAENVYGIFERLLQQGKTIIMVTHDPELAARTHRQLLLFDGELVDQSLANTLDFLSDRRLLWLTHEMKPLSLPAGSDLASAASANPGLILVTRGALEASNQASLNHQLPDRLSAGEYISHLGVNGEGGNLGGLQAAQGQASEILLLPQQAFNHWMEEEPENRKWFSKNQLDGSSNGKPSNGQEWHQ